MAITYEPIASTTLSTTASSITFSSIPQTYTDLVLVTVTIAPNATQKYPVLRFNNDSATNYSVTGITGDGASAIPWYDSNYSSIEIAYAGITNAAPSLQIWNIFSYTGSTYKSVLVNMSNDRNGAGETNSGVGLWRSTDAITSVLWRGDFNGTFAAGTSATLYGIKAA